MTDCEWEHGGFVYFYEQPRHDCFFRVSAAPAEQNSMALQCAIVPYSLVQDETSGVCELERTAYPEEALFASRSRLKESDSCDFHALV